MAADYSYMLKNTKPSQDNSPAPDIQTQSAPAAQSQSSTPFYDMVKRGFLEGGAKWPALLHHPGWEQQFDSDLRKKYPKAKGGLERYWQAIGDGLGYTAEQGLEFLPAVGIAKKFGNFLKFIPEKYRSAAVWSLMNAAPTLKNDPSKFMDDFGRNLALSGLGTGIVTSALSRIQKGLALAGIGAGTSLLNDPKDMASALASATTSALMAGDTPGGRLSKQLKKSGDYSPNQLSQIAKAANDFHSGKPVDPEMLAALKQNKPNPALDDLFKQMEAKTPTTTTSAQDVPQEDTVPTAPQAPQKPVQQAQSVQQAPTPQEQAAMQNHFFPSAAPKARVPPQPTQPLVPQEPTLSAPAQPVPEEMQALLSKMPPELQAAVSNWMQQKKATPQAEPTPAPVTPSVPSHMGSDAGASPSNQNEAPTQVPKMPAKDAEAEVLKHVKNPALRSMIQRGTMQSAFGDPSWGDIASHMANKSVGQAADPIEAKKAIDAYRHNVVGNKAMPTDVVEKMSQQLGAKLPAGTPLPHSDLANQNQEPRVYDLLHGTGFTSRPQESLDAVHAGLHGTPEQGLDMMNKIYDSKIRPGATVNNVNHLDKVSPFNITAGQRLANLVRNLHAAKNPDHPVVADMHKLANKAHNIAASVSMLNSLKALPSTPAFASLKAINTRDWPETVHHISDWLDMHWSNLNPDQREKLQRAFKSMPRPYQYISDGLKKSIDNGEKFSPTEHFPNAEQMAKIHDVFKAFPERDGGATAHLADLQGLSTTPSSDPFVAETRRLLRKENLTRTQLMAELQDAARAHPVTPSVPSHMGSDAGASNSDRPQ